MVEYSLTNDIENQKNYTVAKANDFVRNAKFNLSLGEQRMLNFLISKIPPQAESFADIGTGSHIGYVTFNIQEFARVFNISVSSGNTYSHVKEWLKALRDKSWWVRVGDTDTIMAWLDDVITEPNTGKCSILFHKRIEPYLVALTSQGNYTSYSLYYTTHFKSSYSGRFYELFKSYEYRSRVRNSSVDNVKEVCLQLDELKSMFDEKDSVTKKVTKTLSKYTYKDFKRIMEKSLEEINKYTDINVDYIPIKKGRSVYQIKFIIRSIMGTELLDRVAENRRAEHGVKSEYGQMDIFSPMETKVEPA